jgi:nucleotide-binding universal stress UspA family protein
MKKILLAYDGGEPARHALVTAASLARAFAADLTVVCVVPEHLAGGATETQSARQLHDARDELQELGVRAELLEPAGAPAHKIEQIAAEGGFDTIVMGSWHVPDLMPSHGGGVATHVAARAAGVVVLTH